MVTRPIGAWRQLGLVIGWAGIGSFALPGSAQAAWVASSVRLPGPGALNGVSSSSPFHVWAVGSYRNRYGISRAVILRRDQRGWRIDRIPNPGDPRKTTNKLLAVLAVADRNVWAVGATSTPDHNGVDIGHALIEHWNGVRWSLVPPAPDRDAESGVLQGLCQYGTPAHHPIGVWAVGRDVLGYSEPDDGPLFERWDGKRWKILPFQDSVGVPESCVSPSVASATASTWRGMASWVGGTWSPDLNQPVAVGRLHAMSANPGVGATTLWAVGDRSAVRRSPGTDVWVNTAPTSWTAPGAPILSFVGITSRPHDVWTVGTSRVPMTGKTQGVIYHYTTGWHWVRSLPTGAPRGIARVLGTTKLWIVGARRNGQPLLLSGP